MRPRLLVTLLSLTLLVTACGTSSASSSPSTPAKQLRVAVLISQAAQDGSFNQYLAEGVQNAAAAAGNVKVTLVQQLGSLGASAEASAVGSYARQGYDLVVAHGFDLVPGVTQYAPQFPKVAWATTLPVTGNPPNVAVYLLNFQEFGFAGAYFACLGTKSHIVGLDNGPKAQFDDEELQGFQQGVNQFCPGTKVINVYGDFSDAAKEKEATLALVAQGADSIFSVVSSSQPGVLAACEQTHIVCWANSKYLDATKYPSVYGILDYNYGYFAPQWIQELEAGTFKGGNEFITLENGAISLIATAAGENAIPGLKAKVDSFNSQAKVGGYNVSTSPVP